MYLYLSASIIGNIIYMDIFTPLISNLAQTILNYLLLVPGNKSLVLFIIMVVFNKNRVLIYFSDVTIFKVLSALYQRLL